MGHKHYNYFVKITHCTKLYFMTRSAKVRLPMAARAAHPVCWRGNSLVKIHGEMSTKEDMKPVCRYITGEVVWHYLCLFPRDV